MTEIVPPKLNQDSGMFSLFLNKRNILIAIGLLISLILWSNLPNLTVDQRVFCEILIACSLIPFMFKIYGRATEVFLLDLFKYFLNGKKKKISLGKDISEGIIILTENKFAKVYRLQPINLSMAGTDDILTFKRYIQSALFSLKNQNEIQILTIQQYSTQDENLSIEKARIKKLASQTSQKQSRKLEERAREYLNEYMDLTQTIDRKFYLIISVNSRNITDSKKQFEELENSFIKILEQAKVPVTELNTSEILELTQYILPLSNI